MNNYGLVTPQSVMSIYANIKTEHNALAELSLPATTKLSTGRLLSDIL